MARSAEEHPYSRSDGIFLGATGILTAALLTALMAAFANWIYEFFFDPMAYAAGLPWARALFVVFLTFPFILGGLVFLGLPSAWLLRRIRFANALTYALAGVVTGVLWGATVVALFRPTFGITPHVVDAAFGAVSMLFWWWAGSRRSAIS